ncbi:MAG: hypothetical protein Fur009_6160 [Candidatus Microgenomates bacterium]
MSEKLLKAIFVILLVVLLGEVGYLFYTSKKTNNNQQINNVQTPSSQIDYSKYVINSNQINYLKNLQWTDFDKNNLYYIVENEGYVKNLKEISPNRFSFDIYNENNEILAKDIRIPIIPDAKLTVYQESNNNLYLSNISNLKEGQKIKFQWKYDMTKNPDGNDLVDNTLIIYSK